MPAEMTSDYHERSSIHSWRVIFAGMGMAIAFAGAGIILDWLADGRTNANGVQMNTSGLKSEISLTRVTLSESIRSVYRLPRSDLSLAR